MDWKLIGRRVWLTEADLTAVDGDNRTVEEKRVGMMEKDSLWSNLSSVCRVTVVRERGGVQMLLKHGRWSQQLKVSCRVLIMSV